MQSRRLVGVALVALSACSQHNGGSSDERFAGVQERGQAVMGVDQYTSTHVFESLPDGGRIELQRDTADSADIAQIRKHMQEIREAFSQGDFRLPGMVHAMAVPGTAVMAQEKAAIEYEYRPLPRGGEVRIRTSSPGAVKAVHEFLAFQRMDHRSHSGH